MQTLRNRASRSLAPARSARAATVAGRIVVSAMLLALATTWETAAAATVVVMPNPAALRGDGDAAHVLARLEAVAGTKLTLAGTTRTGAWRLDTGDADAVAAANRLRADRSVLWAQVPREANPSLEPRPKAAVRDGTKLHGAPRGRRGRGLARAHRPVSRRHSAWPSPSIGRSRTSGCCDSPRRKRRSA